MPETLPKIAINNDSRLKTSQLRLSEVFQAADPQGVLPDVVLNSGPLNPLDRPHRGASRVGIVDQSGESVGAFNLEQTRERSWINDINIPERQGEKLGLSTYLGVIAALHSVGRRLESDPQGLSDDSRHIGESLARRQVASVQTGEQDQHGNPRYISILPEVK